MIFDKKVYKKVNYISYFVKKINLLKFKYKNNKSISFANLYPISHRELTDDEISFLNKKCHVQAFKNKSGKSIVEISRCNSCLGCESENLIHFQIIQDYSKVEDNLLPVYRS